MAMRATMVTKRPLGIDDILVSRDIIKGRMKTQLPWLKYIATTDEKDYDAQTPNKGFAKLNRA